MAEQDFKLPDMNKSAGELSNTLSSTGIPSLPTTDSKGEIGTKEMVIGFGAVIVAAIIYVFIKNFVSKMLVSSYKKSPRSADMAGWSLFCILFFATIAGVLGIINATRFLSLPYLIPICLAILASLIMFIISLTSKR
jgi:hypothetical protein